jgi:hypothetical protein
MSDQTFCTWIDMGNRLFKLGCTGSEPPMRLEPRDDARLTCPACRCKIRRSTHPSIAAGTGAGVRVIGDKGPA